MAWALLISCVGFARTSLANIVLDPRFFIKRKINVFGIGQNKINKTMKRIFTFLSLLLLIGLSDSYSQIPTNGLIAWYPFNGNANDSSGHNNNGVITGAIPTADRFGHQGKALLFNGNNQYVSVANNVWSDSLTLSAWINANDFGSTNPQTAGRVIIFKAPNTGYNCDYSLSVGYDQNSQARVSFNFGQGSTQYTSITGNIVLQTNQWYLVTATRANGISKIYINGVMDVSTTYSYTPYNQNFNLLLGMSVNANQSFSGALDELRIYNRALSVQEILNIYNEQLAKALLAWYPCDNNALDFSGNNYNGTLSGPIGTNDRFNQSNKALMFNGNGQYINVPYNVWGSNLTLSAWFYANDYGSTNPMDAGKLIFFKAPNTGYYQDYALCVGYQNTNAKASFTFGQGSSQFVTLLSNTVLQTNQWYLLTTTRENGEAKMYINGVLDNSTTYSFIPTNQNFSLTIGMSNANVQSFNGKLDELLIYNYALTTGQIDSLYHLQSYSINNYDLNNTIRIYPNPTTEKLTIETSLNTKQSVEITNLLGETLYISTINKKKTIDFSSYPKGIYILKLNTDKGTIVRKFVKE